MLNHNSRQSNHSSRQRKSQFPGKPITIPGKAVENIFVERQYAILENAKTDLNF